MKAPGLWDRINDWLNPIVVKELRQAVRSRFVVAVLLIFLLVQVVYLGLHLVIGEIGGRIETLEFEAGRDVFAVLQGILLLTCMLFIPLYTGIRLAAERSEINIDLMYITTLRPRAIITGKLAASLVLALLIFSACAPFMVFTYFLRGIEWPAIFFVVALDFLVVIASVQMTIFFAVIPTNRVLKVILGIIAFGLLVFIFGMTLSASINLLYFGLFRFMAASEFWAGVACSAVGLFTISGLFFTWSIAMIMPPSANRALPSRLFTLAAVLLSSLVFGYSAWGVQTEEPIIYVGLCFLGALSVLMLIIAINEREHWGPRLRKQIPRHWWLRLPAFLFYSGAAGGVLFALLLFGLTCLGLWVWRELIVPLSAAPAIRGRFRRAGIEEIYLVFQTMAVAVLYIYCYALTAVFLRRTLIKIQPVFTWIIMVVLMAVASLVPYLLSFLIYFRDWHYEDHYVWLLANPVAAMMEFAEPTFRFFDHQEVFLTFAGVWAAIVTLVNLPWFFRQIRDFRPMVRSDDHPARDPDEFVVSPTPLEATKTSV